MCWTKIKIKDWRNIKSSRKLEQHQRHQDKHSGSSERKNKGREVKLSEEIMAENFPYLMKIISMQINTKRSTVSHIK